MKKLCLLLVATSCFFSLSNHVFAIKSFQKEFLVMYSGSSSDADFKKSIKEAGCAVCHDTTKYPTKDPMVKKASKKNRNAYGEELAKLLDKKADKKDKTKIQDSLKKVADMKSDPMDAKSKTFGELIKDGKLPAN